MSTEALPDAEEDVLALAEGFADTPWEHWQESVVSTLNRRRPPERALGTDEALASLRTTTVDGLDIDPLYVAGEDQGRALGYPGVPPFVRGTTLRTGQMGSWDVRQLHEDPDPRRSRAQALTDLQRGATSLWIRTGPDAVAPDDLPEVLADVLLDLAPVAVSSRHAQVAAAESLCRTWAERGAAAPRGNLGLDALALAAAGGEADLSVHHHWVRRCLRDLPSVRALTVDVLPYHEAGAGDVEELALAIATGVVYLRDLEAVGIHPRDAAGQIDFRVSAAADQFLTIARLRALRRLWARVGEVCGVPAAARGARQHAVTSWRMLAREDPWVNMLRVTIATFAAAAGGAEEITVLPFDTVHGLPSDFSRRIARNTQVILAEEANVGRVHDPAGGSWYVEALTDQLARRAWDLVQQIEGAGGMADPATRAGLVTDRLAATRQAREERLRDRRLPLTGVSTFPRLEDQPLDRIPRPPAPEVDAAFPRVRDSELFERLRDRSRSHAQRSGRTPTVLVAAIGARKDYGARETFTTSLLGVAGMSTHLVEDLDPSGPARALAEQGLRVVVICSSAALNSEHAAQFARALREAGAVRVLLAGKVHELAAADRHLVDGHLHEGTDVVAQLATILNDLGVPA